jgi:putative transposase
VTAGLTGLGSRSPRPSSARYDRRYRQTKFAASSVLPLPVYSACCGYGHRGRVRDTLADRRGFRTLNIVDDFTHECVAMEVDRSLPGARVGRVLERLAETIGLPRVLISDNGPEFAGRMLDAWAYRRGIELRFIRPGKPIETPMSRASTASFATNA